MMRGMKRNFYKYNRTPSKVVLGNFSILGFHDNSVGKESTCNAGDRGLIPRLGRSTGKGIGLSTPGFLGFLCSSAGKESVCNAGDLGWIPGLRRSPGGRKGYPFQYSGPENSMACIAHGVTKSQTHSETESLSLFTHDLQSM